MDLFVGKISFSKDKNLLHSFYELYFLNRLPYRNYSIIIKSLILILNRIRLLIDMLHLNHLIKIAYFVALIY